MRGDHKPDPVDIHVGRRLRLIRQLAGLSLSETAKACNLAYQQIQKYETGADRMAASRLSQLSRIFNVPIAEFFEDLPSELRDRGRPRGSRKSNLRIKSNSSSMDGRPYQDEAEAAELIRSYYRIVDAQMRRRIYELIKSMGSDVKRARS
jgi:transcriptional regulator with XRE-family HTH domain